MVFEQVSLKRRGRDAPSNTPSFNILGTARGIQGEWIAKKQLQQFIVFIGDKSLSQMDCWSVSVGNFCFSQSYFKVRTKGLSTTAEMQHAWTSLTLAKYLSKKLNIVPSCNISDSLKVIDTAEILHFETLDSC